MSPDVQIADWEGPEGEIGSAVASLSAEALAAYVAAPRLVLEHANIERSAVEGGYGRRQLFELIQNGADELVGTSGRVEVVLSEDALYCANEGRPLTTEGVAALMFAHLSSKSGVEIGRFGLGFKSVLGISRCPEVFSRSGSIRFDPAGSKARIEAALAGSTERAPTLRIAEAVDPGAAAGEDPVLAELMTWATTVVRLRRDAGESAWLEADLAGFPAEFLLFSPHVSTLALRGLENHLERTVTASSGDDASLILCEGGEESAWRVFRTEYRPSDRARADAGALTDRALIPLAWAVETRRGRRGEFWAFFPTLDRTTLSGVVNAPWKLNEDRTRVIDGPFNEELLAEVTRLVTSHMEELTPDDDPGLVLDLMPGRGREAAGWADDQLTSMVNEAARFNPSIPNRLGELELPAALTLHPPDLPRWSVEAWAESPGAPTDWCHPSVERRDRRARAEMYMQGQGRVATPVEWLEALVEDGTPEQSTAAVLLAAALLRDKPELRATVEEARILLAADGSLVEPRPGRIFIRAELEVAVDVAYVADPLSRQEEVREALESIGIHEIDAVRVLESILAEGRADAWGREEWLRFWDLARRSAPQEVFDLLRSAGVRPLNLAVRTRAGSFTRLDRVLLPGDIISATGMDDAQAALDTQFHREEMPLLRLLGATTAPVPAAGDPEEAWLREYEQEALDDYVARLSASGASPNPEYLGFRRRPLPGPAAILDSELSPKTRARLTMALLNAAEDLRPWTFCHRSQTKYPERAYPNPIVWLALRSGTLPTSMGLAKPRVAVGPALTEFAKLLPVAEGLPAIAAEAFELPASLDELTEAHWKYLMKRAGEVDSEVLLGRAYLAAATHGVAAPKSIRCKVGPAFDDREVAEVVVTADDEEAAVLTKNADPFLRVPDQAGLESLTGLWGFRRSSEAIRQVVGFVQSGESEALADLFPMLKLKLEPEALELEVVPCSELRLESYTDAGLSSGDHRLLVHDGRIYRRDDVDDRRFLEEASNRLGMALDQASIEAIIRNLEGRKIRDHRRRIRAAESNAEKVLIAIGVDALRTGIPPQILATTTELYGAPDERETSELALAVHGVEILQKHREDLEQRGLDPPVRWAGGRRAVAFVRELGFDDAYAGFETVSVDPQVLVDGPIELPPLHPYQEVVVGEIRSLIGATKGRRGLLCLPTGAGKTRVMIESLIDAVRAGELDSPILWVAQTEELCEQAVESWGEVWRGIGPRRRLTVSRLWGSFNAPQAELGDQVVVATIQKLAASVFESDEYGWLKESASCVVVDEAHQSVGRSYSDLLRWQGLDSGGDRAPLIGLTATPFRGVNVEETKRLVSRYGGRRLDLDALGGADAYPRLQELGMLSHVDHKVLEGSDLQLSEAELAELAQLRRLPAGPISKLAGDTRRNRTLIESIGALDPEWPVLLFALSVQHAVLMAALLRREGITAAAVTGETDQGARRHYIETFRNGGLRVLANYNVLTAGFDAPRVRALYVARPTYSPNAYQQMIGRGLRGPKNNGTERCLLVNVADNVTQFGEQLAFHEFDYLWNGSGI